VAKRILLIEDDQELGAQIVKRLEDAGYQPTWWREGRRLAVADLADVELVILDIMLPGVYGIDMLKELRAFSEVPVLILSARVDTVDKVRALKLGADDYMTKPFWPEELLERVAARLRRPVLVRSEVVEIGPLRLNRETREVFVSGERVDLTRVEYELLATLALRPGAAVTRRALCERVLDPDRDADERTLDVHISRLRKKLGQASLVQTVWGVGYRLAAGTAS